MKSWLVVLLLLLPISAAAQTITVVDGDTITVDGRAWRLLGFDTPETLRAKCEAERVRGDLATKRLRALIAIGPVTLRNSGRTDKYQRVLGDVMVGGVNVGDTLIAEGHARPYGGKRRGGWC